MLNLPPKYDPTGVGTHQSDDETNDPVIADHLNFYKVEKCQGDRADNAGRLGGSGLARCRSANPRGFACKETTGTKRSSIVGSPRTLEKLHFEAICLIAGKFPSMGE